MSASSDAARIARPKFADLPLKKDGPRGNIWGLFGDADELGLLNYITQDKIQDAVKEIKSGFRISLDYPLNHFPSPAMGRQALEQKIMQFPNYYINDETITMNTQASTQWDGFRHFAYQDAQRYYNGCTQEDVEKSTRIGIHAWAKRGGIVTRGVLLDYHRWATLNGKQKTFFDGANITASELQQVAESQGVKLRDGDVLLIRSGFMSAHQDLSATEQLERHKNPIPLAMGLESSEAMLKFIWNSGIVAIAGDMPALEAWPPQNMEFCLHEWLLAGWGCPIGEYFNLEELSKHCEQIGTWSFFFTSMPLNIPGGVASPANAMAIF